MKTKTAKTKKAVAKKAAEVKRDKYGFREGTHVSKLFAALMKGATMEDLKKITGAVTSKTIADFKKAPSKSPRGRSAVIESNEKSGVMKIKGYKVPTE